MNNLIDWVVVGWVIDVIFNGIIWFIIALFLLPIINVSDKYTRKAISFMDKFDKWTRKILDIFLDWIQKKNLRILFAFVSIILLGMLDQFEIIPKIIK